MKTKRFILTALVVLSAVGPAISETNEVSALLQKGLFEEEANRNLDAAIQAYQAVVTQTDKDRQFAATAIFRSGECYRKQGKTNEANAQYRRILREFSDQAELAKLSRDYVGDSAAAISPSKPTGLEALQGQIAAAKAEIDSYQRQLEELREPDMRRVFAQQHFPNPVLNTLMQRMAEIEQKVAEQKASLGDHHPDVEKSAAVLKTVSDQMDTQIRVIMTDLAEKMNAAESSVKELEKKLKQVKEENQPGTAVAVSPGRSGDSNQSTQPAAIPDHEADEIKRLQAMSRDSPDLINARDSEGITPLNAAARNGQLKVVKFLLDNKANIETRDGSTLTPLLSAARAGSKEIVELLLDRGANVNAVSTANINHQFSSWYNPEGFSALHYAVSSGNKGMSEVLLAHGAKVDAKDVSGSTALMLAARSGFKTIAEMLIAHGADVNAGDAKGSTALIAAITAGNRAVTELLLANKADVNLKTRDGLTPLIAAVNAGQPDTVTLLLKHGADTRSKMADDHASTPRWTALDAAIVMNDNATIKLLLENHADPNATFDLGDRGNVHERDSTPLILAAGWQHRESAQILLANKAEVNWRNGQGTTALWIAVNKNDTALVGLLLDNGADPKIKYDTANGWTVLHLAARDRRKELAELLLAHGANANAQDNTGETPLHLAVSLGEREMVALLLAHGADANLKDHQGQTALDLAEHQSESGNQLTLTGPFSGTSPLSYQWNFGASEKASPSTNDMAILLRQHGALAEADISTLRVMRGEGSPSRVIFKKDATAYNHRYMLFELIERMYDGAIPGAMIADSNIHFFTQESGLTFPDFSRLMIVHRPANGRTNIVTMDLDKALATGDCSKDVSLEWGDIVKIPELDHKVSDLWTGLSQSVKDTLVKCLAREVEIMVKGQATRFRLRPDYSRLSGDSGGLPASTARSSGDAAGKISELPSFWLNDVVNEANVILSSSDLTRVKVKRVDPGTNKNEEMVFNLGKGVPENDLWLRDGDVIEIPEKQ